jgi:SAM-dependent methyltransferase
VNAETNREFYDTLWRAARLIGPERFNTWPVVAPLAARSAACLEIGAGLRPRLPLAGTVFLDASAPAVRALRDAGARALVGDVGRLPFPDASFSLVGAFDVIEHVEDDASVFRELARVLAPGGSIVCSVPLHATDWTAFDEIVGHWRRYDPAVFERRLGEQGLHVVESAVYGMQPKKGWLLDCGTWWLRHRRAQALRWYNWFLPISLHWQKPLRFEPGLVARPAVDEIIAVCGRGDVAS